MAVGCLGLNHLKNILFSCFLNAPHPRTTMCINSKVPMVRFNIFKHWLMRSADEVGKLQTKISGHKNFENSCNF